MYHFSPLLLNRGSGEMESEMEWNPTSSGMTGTSVKTILLADDDKFVRRGIRAILEMPGYRVIEAIDGEDTIGKIKEFKDMIDLIILDIMMPKKNGANVDRFVLDMCSGIKVICMNGYPYDVFRRKALVRKGYALISKPFSPDELICVVRKELAGA